MVCIIHSACEVKQFCFPTILSPRKHCYHQLIGFGTQGNVYFDSDSAPAARAGDFAVSRMAQLLTRLVEY